MKHYHDQLGKSLPPKEDQMTQKEVAELFDRTVQTIIRWKKEGIIPYYQLGRSIIFSKNEILQVASRNQHLLK